MTTATQDRAQAIARELTRPVNAVLLATALAQTERERMDAIDRELLAATVYHVADEWTERGMDGLPERITDHKDAFLMSEADAEDYYAQRQERIDALGHNLPRGHCPALCAEEVQRDAEHVLIDAAEPFFPGVTLHKLLCAGLDKHREYLDLLMKLVINSPGYVAPKLPKV